MNVGEGIEIEDSSLGLIILGIITAIALFMNQPIAFFSLCMLSLQLFKNELKSLVSYVVGWKI